MRITPRKLCTKSSKIMIKFLSRIWNSSTVMTWASFAARSGSLLFVTPLVLTRFTTAEISLWYFFLTIAGLILMADFGFAPSFVRAFAYARAGRRELKSADGTTGVPNNHLVGLIYKALQTAYVRLTGFGLLGGLLLGTWAAVRPIGELSNITEGWGAWIIVLVCTALNFRNGAYGVWLQGMNHVALIRRCETAVSLVSTLVTAVTILATKSFLCSIIAAQVMSVLSSLVIRLVSIRVCKPPEVEAHAAELADVFAFIWPAAWRSGIGVVMSNAVIQASGIIYAQLDTPEHVAPYLLAMRIIQTIVQISMAPFYSKIPQFATLYAAGETRALVSRAVRAMAACHWVYTSGILFVALFGQRALDLVHSKTHFVPVQLWMLIGVGFLLERIGAMHIQFYSLSNHILWHIANGVSGTIYLITSFLLIPKFGAYAFPLGIIAGYGGFYTWFAARLVYRHYGCNPFMFELRTSVAPCLLIVGCAFLSWSH